MKSTPPPVSRCQLAATKAAISIAALLLASSGCGGSEDNGTIAAQSEDAGPVRFLSTSYNFRGNQLLLLMSFAGGLTYGFYQADFTRPSYEYAYDGMFVVRRLPGARSSDPTIGLDYDFQNGTTRPATLALAAPNEFGIALGALTNVVAVPPANTTVTEPIGARESDNASLDTNPTTLSGTYAVQGRSVNASLKFPARIDNGRLTAMAADGCALEATLQPRPKGNVYDVKATFGPGCPIAAGAFEGHALQAYVADNVILLLESPTQGGVMLLLGSRQVP
jgi:hypothetical protein